MITNKHILFDVKGITHCYDHEFVLASSIAYGNNNYQRSCKMLS